MKKLAVLLAALILTCNFAFSQTVGRKDTQPTVTVAWDDPHDPTITGFNLYWGTISQSYSAVVSVPGNVFQTTISLPSWGLQYYFAATSTDGALESVYSPEVSWKARTLPSQPTLHIVPSALGVQVSATGASPGEAYALDVSFDLQAWLETARFTADSSGNFSFLDSTLAPHKWFSARAILN